MIFDATYSLADMITMNYPAASSGESNPPRLLKRHQNPFTWNEPSPRGMNAYHDLLDWLGELPYEVASKEEILGASASKGFVLEKIKECSEGANNIYLFSLQK